MKRALAVSLLLLLSLLPPHQALAADPFAGSMQGASLNWVALAQTPMPSRTPLPRQQYGDYRLAMSMFGTGWWKDEVRYTQANILIDTIEQGGLSASVWLLIDDAAWRTGMEVFFDQSLMTAGVKPGDILRAYCEGIEPWQEWGRENGKQVLLAFRNRAQCHSYDILSKAERDRLYSAVEHWFD